VAGEREIRPRSAHRRGPAANRRLGTVERVLLTGMSGSGKSRVIRELGALGYKAVDT
jgi:energy-coupling factor transporter ATP-binding protein EcfA2